MDASHSQVALRIPIVRQVSGGACLISVDSGGRVCSWTRDAEVVFGHTTAQAVGLHLEQLVPFLTDRSRELEGWCRRIDGSAFRGLVASLSAADESADEDLCQVLVVTDITSRYMREQASQRVRERIDEVTTSVAHLAFFSLDYVHEELEMWGAFADVIGLAGKVAPRRLSELVQFVHRDDRAALADALDQAIATGSEFEVEVRVDAELGERWLLLVGSLVEGASPRIVGAGLNVTRQRALDEALRTSEARLHAVLEATSDGVMTIDPTGAIAALNPAAIAMFRAGDVTLSGAPYATLLDIASDILPGSGMLEAIGRRMDGTTFACECGFTEIELGIHPFSIVVLRDMTQRRLLEHQVLEASEQLQRQIGQDLHDGLGQLLTGTAFLAKGLQHGLSSEQKPQAQRVVELINLAIARVRSLARGLSPIHVEARSLEAVLRSTVSEASELLGVSCQLELVDFIDDAQPAAIAQLCLIAREAITNAVRHGHAQHIIVQLARVDGQSVLSVEDDGVGIGDVDKPLEGLGLRSMRHRAKMIGGKLDIVRTRSGTTVRCSWNEP